MAHPDNMFYGHSRVLLRAAGASEDDVIHGHIQHGWMPGSGLMPRRREVPWIPKLLWNSSNVRVAREEGQRRVTPIGAPFIYLHDDDPPAPPGSGTLVYPHHSWEKDEMAADHNSYIAQLSEREKGAVTVCLYWREFEDPTVRGVYESAGFRVICHGRREDPDFLLSARKEITAHARVVSNRVGTALWYAGHLGRSLAVYGPLFVAQETTAEAMAAHQSSRDQWPELFRDDGIGPALAKELSAGQLGTSHRRDAAELRLICRIGRARWRARADRVAVHAAHRALTLASLGQRLVRPNAER
jgi:hypothetical protein